MSPQIHDHFDNSYSRLPIGFYKEAQAAQFPNPSLVELNIDVANQLEFRLDGISSEVIAKIFSGQIIPMGANPVAMVYAGHQFANFVPVLGDGRAMLLGEIVTSQGHRKDIHFKGSGPTIYSRRGDGKSALGPVLRELIISEYFRSMKIPSSWTLAAVATGEKVMRHNLSPGGAEEWQPGGVLTRIADCHIRVGTFEYFAARRAMDELQILLRYCLKRFHPTYKSEFVKGEEEASPEDVLFFFRSACQAQCRLIPKWMGIGFIHGVMNTDNMCIVEQTLDFGPCAFMEEYNPAQVFSSIDRRGRYAFNQQPSIAIWNMQALGTALLPLLKGIPEDEALRLLSAELDSMGQEMESSWIQLFGQKLGLESPRAEDVPLMHLFFEELEASKKDFTNGFRELSTRLSKPPESEFERAWQKRIEAEGRPMDQIQIQLDAINPIYIPRNHLVERALRLGIQGDFSFLRKLLQAIRSPFEVSDLHSELTGPVPSSERVEVTFCGT